jgi:hypothetical protein
VPIVAEEQLDWITQLQLQEVRARDAVRQSPVLGWLIPLLAAALILGIAYAQYRLKWVKS